MLRTSGSLLVAGTTSDAGKSVLTAGSAAACPAGGAGRAVQGAEHVQQLGGRAGRARDRAGAGGAGGRGRDAGRGGHEPGAAQAGQRPAQPSGGAGRAVGEASAPATGIGRGPGPAAGRCSTPRGLRSRFDVVICEGRAARPRSTCAADIVNLGLARAWELPVIVVGDIDRGGVFAALYGTLALLDAADQSRRRVRHQQVPRRPRAARPGPDPDRRADRPSGPRRAAVPGRDLDRRRGRRRHRRRAGAAAGGRAEGRLRVGKHCGSR